jgi:hypothetical protein
MFDCPEQIYDTYHFLLGILLTQSKWPILFINTT